MILEVQSEFSNKQALSTSADKTVSQDVMDLGEYFYRSGYPADAGGTGAQSNLVYRDTAKPQGAGFFQIMRKFGTQYFPFLCQVVEEITEANMTGLDVEFRVTNTAPASGQTTYAADTGDVVAVSGISAENSGESGAVIPIGTQVPWPNIPRFVRGRYLFLQYVVKGGSGGVTKGKMSAGFTVAVPTFG